MDGGGGQREAAVNAIYLIGGNIVVTTKSEREMRGSGAELLQHVSDSAALAVVKAICRQHPSATVTWDGVKPKRRRTAEQKLAQSRRQTGSKRSAETRAKMSAAKKGKPSNVTGYKWTAAQKQAHSVTHQAMRDMAKAIGKPKREGSSASGKLVWHDPYSGDTVRLLPDAKPPAGWLRGHAPHVHEAARVAQVVRWSGGRHQARTAETDLSDWLRSVSSA